MNKGPEYRATVQAGVIRPQEKGMLNKREVPFRTSELAGLETDGHHVVRVHFKGGQSFRVHRSDVLQGLLGDRS